MKVAIVLDSPKRDLLGVVLISYQLLKLNADVFIVPMYNQGYDIPLIAPDVVIVNYTRINNLPLLKQYRSLGIVVIVMDTEGGVLSESGSDAPDNWAKLFRNSRLNTVVDGYFFWGPRVHTSFVEHSGLPAERLKVTGCPRYDLCHQVWQKMLDYPRRDYVLINTNFSSINPAFTASVDSEVSIFKQVGWERNYVHQLFEELKRVFPLYLDVIARLAAANPEKTFLLRPHPFERVAFYERHFAAYANIVVDGSGNVLNAIRNADAIVHLNCGTAVETVLLGKVPISMEFLNSATMRQHAPLPSSISCKAHDFDELNLLVNRPDVRAACCATQELIENVISPWFSRIDGNAARRVAEATIAIVDQARGAAPKLRRSVRASISSGRSHPSLAQLLQGLACNIIGSHYVSRIRAVLKPARRDKNISPATVLHMLSNFMACEGSILRLRSSHARHPLTRVPLASVKLVTE